MARATAVNPNNWTTLPPTRWNQRFSLLPVDISSLAFEGRSGGGRQGSSGYLGMDTDEIVQSYARAIGTKDLSRSDFEQTQVNSAAYLAAGLTDFIYVKLKGRGEDGGDLIYRFLINPSNVDASRQVVDGEAQTRMGLTTGIWGDLLDITVSGTTAGSYFAGSLVDEHDEYSASNRNFKELLAVYENNGCWFEGEAMGDPSLPGDITRKLIQLHGDVTLVFGNFIWSGAFTEMSLDETSDTPYYNKFSFSFMAWRERFASGSPWRDSITNEDYYGHAYEVYKQKGGSATPETVSNSLPDAQGGILHDATLEQLDDTVSNPDLPMNIQKKMM